jgi:hypothetical protein
METHYAKTVHPDAKGRITLGALAKGISSFQITTQKDGRIILEPYVEIPAREKWLFQNEKALKQVKKGLQDSAKGRVSKKGDFSQYLGDEID